MALRYFLLGLLLMGLVGEIVSVDPATLSNTTSSTLDTENTAEPTPSTTPGMTSEADKATPPVPDIISGNWTGCKGEEIRNITKQGAEVWDCAGEVLHGNSGTCKTTTDVNNTLTVFIKSFQCYYGNDEKLKTKIVVTGTKIFKMLNVTISNQEYKDAVINNAPICLKETKDKLINCVNNTLPESNEFVGHLKNNTVPFALLVKNLDFSSEAGKGKSKQVKECVIAAFNTTQGNCTKSLINYTEELYRIANGGSSFAVSSLILIVTTLFLFNW